MGVLTWSPLAFGFLTGKYRQNQDVDLSEGRAGLRPDRFDPAHPGNAAKYAAVEQFIELAQDLDCTLPQLAFAFPLAHPAVTSVIIGPRTLEQLHQALKGATVVLDDEALNRIDEIVPPGTDLWDVGSTPVSLSNATLRRRPVLERAAAEPIASKSSSTS